MFISRKRLDRIEHRLAAVELDARAAYETSIDARKACQEACLKLRRAQEKAKK